MEHASTYTLHMRREAQLLVHCARVLMDAQRAGQIRRLVESGIDWARLLDGAYLHGMRPLLYWHLNTICPALVPPETLDQLRDHFHKNAGRNLLMAGELLKLLRLLEAEGIQAIPYKGPALAAAVYGNLALREFVDLDILVRLKDAPRARRLMISLGYRPQLDLPGAQEAAFMRYHCEHFFVHPDNEIYVELQWAIAPRFFSLPLDYERLWERLEPVNIAGKQALTLSAEDSLLILSIHGSKHLWARLEWVCGVAEMIRVYKQIDWEKVFALAKEARAGRMLLLGLSLAADLLEADIPLAVRQSIEADPKIKLLAARVREQLFCEPVFAPGIFECGVFHLRMREHWRDRVRYCLRISTTPTVGDWALLPATLSFPLLHYPLRAIRLIGKYGLRLLR